MSQRERITKRDKQSSIKLFKKVYLPNGKVIEVNKKGRSIEVKGEKVIIRF